MSFRYHPATLALLGRGVGLEPFAEAYGVTRTTVCRWLSGVNAPPAGFFETVAALTDRATAARVADLVAEARSARR